MTATPYSYAQGGVSNTRVRVAEDSTLADMVAAFQKPVALAVTSIEYHNASKKERTAHKKQLPYFVGGVLDGKRDDKNVTQRTLITLDIEQHQEGGEQPPAPQVITQRLEELGGEGWVYTSISHTPSRPRYRVVLPLGKPIEDMPVDAMQDAMQSSTVRAAKQLGLGDWCTPESWVLSQPMFLPAKLKGGQFYSHYTQGKAWASVQGAKKERKDNEPADIPDERPDPILAAIKAAGLYLQEDPKHHGKHFIQCPCLEQHGAENETQTVYYEPHYDGNPHAAVKCFDTEPDVDGHPHLTYKSLVRWLKGEGHLTDKDQLEAGVLEDIEEFYKQASVGRMLDTEPVPREWAIPQFAPVGKVTVLAGPGGQGKSLLMLHLLAHAAMGMEWAVFKPAEEVCSVYVSYEDDFQELHGRVHRLTQDMRTYDDGVLDLLNDVDGSIRKNMFVFAAEENAQAWLLLTKPERFSAPERTARVEWLVETLKARKVKLLCLDPAVYTHQLEENNIADMAQFMQTLSYIGAQAECAVVVLHHMNKSSSWLSIDDINQGGLRGASSFADNARSVAIGVSMTPKDAPLFGLPEDPDIGQKYLVFKHVKHNYSASLGTVVFERKGPRLVPRLDIQRLSSSQVTEAREQHKQEEVNRRVMAYVPRLLETLSEHDGPISQNQVALAMNAKSSLVKAVLEYCASEDYVDITDGPNRSRLHELTPTGKSYLKLVKKEAKK